MSRFKLLLIFTCMSIAICKAEMVHTKLSSGSRINGYVIKRDGRKIHVFRVVSFTVLVCFDHSLNLQGIPYAEKPTNKLRFQKPRPTFLPWHKSLNALSSEAACPGSTVLLTNQTINESCLFMDVFADELCTVNFEACRLN